MDLRDYYNTLFLLLFAFTTAFGQATDVNCINPKFDQLVEEYLDKTVPTISVAEAYENKQQFTFLDARELSEFNTSHIANAIHVGYDNFDIATVPSSISKDDKIIIYCSIGYRSEKIGEKLRKKGYKNVFNLYGSIFEWVNQHHPIVDQNGANTTSLHTYNKKWSKWVNNEMIKKSW